MAEASRRPAGPSVRTGVVVLILAVTFAIGAAVKIVPAVVSAAVDVVNAPVMTTPGTGTIDLEGDQHYLFFELTGHSEGVSGGGFSVGSTENGAPVIGPARVRVTSPSGAIVPVGTYRGSQRITRGSDIYTASLAITAPTSGRYRVEVRESPPGRLMVAHDLGDSFAGLAVWFGLAGVAVLTAITGGALLAIGVFRRSRQDVPRPTFTRDTMWPPARPSG